MSAPFFYSHDLFNLLVDTIPLLVRSKRELLMFFRGAGVDPSYYSDLQAKILIDRKSVSKAAMTRTILERLSEQGERTQSVMLNIVRRVTDVRDFSGSWDHDRPKAEALVSKIRDGGYVSSLERKPGVTKGRMFPIDQFEPWVLIAIELSSWIREILNSGSLT